VTARNQAMIRMPEITTPAAIPILTARQTSAMFIVVFLCSGRWKYKNARRDDSPGVDSGLSPRSVAVTVEVGKYLFLGISPDVSLVG
jgi:hypothetical protein